MEKQHGLSKREIQVVKLLREGKSNKQIAVLLGVSEGTIEFHLTNIYSKLEVGSRVEAIILLAQPGYSLDNDEPKNLGETIVEKIENQEETPEELVPGNVYDQQEQISSEEGNEMIGKKDSPPTNIAFIVVFGLVLALIATLVFLIYLDIHNPRMVNEPVALTSTPLLDLPFTKTPTHLPEFIFTRTPTPLSEIIITKTQPSLTEIPVEAIQSVSLRIPRTWLTGTRLNDDRILIVGGSNGENEQYGSVEIFDPASGLFSSAANLYTPRHEHTATLLLDNRVLVVGGYNYLDRWLADAEVYDPSTNSWTLIPPIHSHGVQHTATLMNDGRVLVVGGCIGSGVCTERVEIFNPSTNSWTETKPLAAYRASHTAVLLDDGRVLLAGGGGPDGLPTDGDALLFDPSTESWETTGSMIWHSQQAQMVKLSNGRVLVAGGLSVSDYPVPSAGVEIYDPESNTWTSGSALLQPRYGNVLILLPNGQAIALGGAREYDYPENYPNVHPWIISSFVKEIEIYDPQSDRWYIAGELPKPLTYCAAAFLPDGALWLTGGGAGHAISPAWAETWIIKPMAPFSGWGSLQSNN